MGVPQFSNFPLKYLFIVEYIFTMENKEDGGRNSKYGDKDFMGGSVLKFKSTTKVNVGKFYRFFRISEKRKKIK